MKTIQEKLSILSNLPEQKKRQLRKMGYRTVKEAWSLLGEIEPSKMAEKIGFLYTIGGYR